MPVFRSDSKQIPAWCEMEHFDIVRLGPGQTHKFARLGKKEKLIVAEGIVRLLIGKTNVVAPATVNIDVPDGQTVEVVEAIEPSVLVRMCGRWGEITGGSGLFEVVKAKAPHNAGDPVDYPTQAVFDRHFHDCDEYWILYEGSGEVVTEGKRYKVGPGDCVAIGTHHHHDFPVVNEPVKAVYFETTLEGQGRIGHLWEHKHGKAHPRMDRV